MINLEKKSTPKAIIFSFAVKMDSSGNILIDKQYVPAETIKGLNFSEKVDIPVSELMEIITYMHEAIKPIEIELNKICRTT